MKGAEVSPETTVVVVGGRSDEMELSVRTPMINQFKEIIRLLSDAGVSERSIDLGILQFV